MGQTLSHGVYLPNEGERNCYAGLASNWQILNTAVGNIAEKAPLVHTHGNISSDGKVGTTANLPLITGTGGAVQAGAFGNQANTFCEGNDSRLSDARTPVAHTHTKSDVTDLLNSNFIPSANNSYDLGSSSYQWNNVYAKGYYYNGTAWGLDKANTWTGNNTFTAKNLYHIAEDPSYILKSSTMQEGVIPSGNKIAYAGAWLDKNSNALGYDRFAFYTTGLQTYEVNIRNKATNGSFDPNGSLIQSGFQLSLYPSGNSELKIYAHTLPNGNGVWNLGDSTHKWKTLNDINPGALSLPSEDASSVNLDPTNWNLTGASPNYYTPPANGWLGVQVTSADTTDLTGQFLFVGRATGGVNYYPEGGTTSINVNSGQGTLMGQVFIPVISGKLYHIRVKIGVDLTHGSSITARFYPCLGNV